MINTATITQIYTDTMEWRERLRRWQAMKDEAERLDGLVVRRDRPDDGVPRKRVAIVTKNWERETHD